MVERLDMFTPGPAVAIPDNAAGSKANASWYRGETTNFLPDKAKLFSDLGLTGILAGHGPGRPFIGSETAITAFGSCFAENIASWLHAKRYNVQTRGDAQAYVVRCGEGMVNSFAILGQFQWAFEGRVPDGEFWHGYDAEAFGYDEQVRRTTRAIFDKTDLFILTFGLSEVWYDKPTGEVFWRAVPADKFDTARHAFRLSTVAENQANISAIFDLIGRYRPDAQVVVTLSPIPLVATFRPMSCLTANAVSKATLRVAIDAAVAEAKRDGRPIHYWPSYEFVTEYFADAWKPDRRHVRKPILDFIMTAFERVYSLRPPSDAELKQRLFEARIADGTIPRKVSAAIRDGDRAALARALERMKPPADALLPLIADVASASESPGRK